MPSHIRKTSFVYKIEQISGWEGTGAVRASAIQLEKGMKKTSKINWRRTKEIKLRKPVPMKYNRVILPDNRYNRKKLKELDKLINQYYKD